MKFIDVIAKLGQLALAGMAAIVVAAGLTLIAGIAFPSLLAPLFQH